MQRFMCRTLQSMLVGMICIVQTWSAGAKGVEHVIARHVNEVVSEAFPGESSATEMVKNQFRRLRFLSSDNEWKSSEFEDLGRRVLSGDVLQKVQDLVSEMANVASRNDYLHRALEETVQFDQNGQIVEEMKAVMDPLLPDIATYAYVLEEVNHEVVSNPEFLESVYSHFESFSSQMKQAEFCHKVKHYSVKFAVDGFREALRKGEVAADFASMTLPINIAEATILDWWYDRFGNVKAGKALMKHCLDGTASKRTGQLPAQFNESGSGLLLTPPFPTDWAKLYATWNMGFIANLKVYPFHVVKLMIPSVNDFYAQPGQYMFNRTLALYVHGYYVLFRDHDEPTFRKMKLQNDTVAEAFGRANAQSAKEYKAKFKK